MYSFRDVVLDEDLHRVGVLGLSSLGECDVERQPQVPDRVGGGADLADALERDAVEQRLHVRERIDGHPDPAHLSAGVRVIGVEAELRGEIKSDRENPSGRP